MKDGFWTSRLCGGRVVVLKVPSHLQVTVQCANCDAVMEQLGLPVCRGAWARVTIGRS